MSQYISVYFDGEVRYYENKGLRSVIEYIGRQEHRTGHLLASDEAYKHGKKIINSQLNKWHKKTIDRLVKACGVTIPDDCTSNRVRPEWKIHKSKARSVFCMIFCLLKRYNNPSVCSYFATLCAQLGFDYGADMIGHPYYPRISDEIWLVAENYDKADREILFTCAREIEAFSAFYKA